jgi:hypothetical protein
LPSYFLLFSIWEENKCLSWDETLEWAEFLGIPTVPILYRGPWDDSIIEYCFTGISQCGGDQEGYVVRTTSSSSTKAKILNIWLNGFVKIISTNEHWLNQITIPNKLKS